MSVLEIAIGSLKYSMSCKEEESGKIKELSNILNRKINTISLKTGRLDNTVVFVLLALINSNKVNKLKNKQTNSVSFDDNLLNSIKNFSHLLEEKSTPKTLEDKLLLCNLILENEVATLEKNLGKEEIEKLTKNELSTNDNIVSEDIVQDYESLANNFKEVLSLVENLNNDLSNNSSSG